MVRCHDFRTVVRQHKNSDQARDTPGAEQESSTAYEFRITA